MKISCTNLMLKGSTLTEQAFFLKEAGFDAISVFEELCGWNDRKYGELQNLKQNTASWKDKLDSGSYFRV